jgi:hypothetical protein
MTDSTFLIIIFFNYFTTLDSFNISKKPSKELQGTSLYEILQENKANKQEEFYGESKGFIDNFYEVFKIFFD